MDGTVFAFAPDWVSTLNAPFMTNAFLAGLCIALAAGVMGYFTIARHSTFAAHALAHRSVGQARHAAGDRHRHRARLRHRPWLIFRTYVKFGLTTDAVDFVRIASDDYRQSDHWLCDFRCAAVGGAGRYLSSIVI